MHWKIYELILKEHLKFKASKNMVPDQDWWLLYSLARPNIMVFLSIYWKLWFPTMQYGIPWLPLNKDSRKWADERRDKGQGVRVIETSNQFPV